MSALGQKRTLEYVRSAEFSPVIGVKIRPLMSAQGQLGGISTVLIYVCFT
jgi:hypothetical protein